MAAGSQTPGGASRLAAANLSKATGNKTGGEAPLRGCARSCACHMASEPRRTEGTRRGLTAGPVHPRRAEPAGALPALPPAPRSRLRHFRSGWAASLGMRGAWWSPSLPSRRLEPRGRRVLGRKVMDTSHFQSWPLNSLCSDCPRPTRALHHGHRGAVYLPDGKASYRMEPLSPPTSALA